MKKLVCLVLTAAMVLGMTACGQTKEADKITSVDQLAGKKVGVQTGTTGDLYFVDFYAGETAGGGSHQTGTML